MQKVAESLQKETHMASYVSQIRQDQKIAGVVVRECIISKQLDIVGTSVPKLEHLLQSFSSRIIESTKEQFVQVTQAIETNAKSLADSLADVQVNILEAARTSDTQHSGSHAISHQLVRDIHAVLCPPALPISPPAWYSAAAGVQPIHREFFAHQLRPNVNDDIAAFNDGGQFDTSVSALVNCSNPPDFHSYMSYDAHMPCTADYMGDDFGDVSAFFALPDILPNSQH
jgi:hypothetical protein